MSTGQSPPQVCDLKPPARFLQQTCYNMLIFSLSNKEGFLMTFSNWLGGMKCPSQLISSPFLIAPPALSLHVLPQAATPPPPPSLPVILTPTAFTRAEHLFRRPEAPLLTRPVICVFRTFRYSGVPVVGSCCDFLF